MYSLPQVTRKTSQIVCHCSACLAKKDLMRAMEQTLVKASSFCAAPDQTSPKLICLENVGQDAYRSEGCFLHSHITMPWLIQNLSHRASSN